MRAKTPKDYSLNNINKCQPGPADYESYSTLDMSRNKGILMNSRFQGATGGVISRSGRRVDKDSFMMNGWIDNPGPGNYDNNLEFNKKGSYIFCKWKNSGAPKFDRASRNINLDKSVTRKITPGPGAYRATTEFGFVENTAESNPYQTIQSRHSVQRNQISTIQ
ncbi:UNKNOWN [Stylonychia lemnae]|uniref:Uncharacterized protein n=1 Tax=Stylonychia lemnae TaxID=5949 RepID=A0A078B1W6_STYLE|nr:UNKNOWN [Stylonychia lemnae]|eukprot:CDW87287.1 UNKNOWN [Stylonychia lemnae]